MDHARRRRYSNVRYPLAFMFLRGWSFGMLGGLVTGAVVGTLLAPIVGTMFGTIYGLVVGALIALPCALTLTIVSPLVGHAAAATLAGSLIAIAWAVAAVVAFDLTDTPGVALGGVVLNALVGAWVAPRATFRRDTALPLVDARPASHSTP